MALEKWYKVQLEEEFTKNDRLTKEMVDDMRKWLQTQKHLPQQISDVELVWHIQSCEFDLDWAKRSLDVNYTIRTKAEFFKNRDPYANAVAETSNCLMYVTVKDIDGKGNYGLLAKLNDANPSNYIYDGMVRNAMLLMDLMRVQEGTIPGITTILDLTGFTLTHLFKVPFGSLRHTVKFLQEGSPTKIGTFHIINTKGSVIDKVMVVLKPLLSERLANAMLLHDGHETLYDHGIKREKLPEEFGGTVGTFRQLKDDTFEELKLYADFFSEEEKLRNDESKRPQKKYFGLL